MAILTKAQVEDLGKQIGAVLYDAERIYFLTLNGNTDINQRLRSFTLKESLKIGQKRYEQLLEVCG